MSRTLVVIFSLFAPGAGHACRGLWQQAAVFGGLALVAGAAAPALAAAGGDLKEFAARSLASALAGLVLRLWSAFDAVRGFGEEERPSYLRGAAAVAAYIALSFAVTFSLAGARRPAAPALNAPLEAGPFPKVEGAGPPEAAPAITGLGGPGEAPPPGPFVFELKGDVFFDREGNSFTLPPGHAARAEAAFGDPGLQQALIYPRRMYKDLDVGNKTLGELYRDGLLLLEVHPVPAAYLGEPDLAGQYEAVMRGAIKANPAWGARLERTAAYPLPGLLLVTQDPPMSQLYLYGRRRYFVLKGDSLTPPMAAVAGSLAEAPEKAGN